MKPLTGSQITAKMLLDGCTYPNGDLLHKDDDREIVYDNGSKTVLLSGYFEAETLIEIAMHMRSTQK